MVSGELRGRKTAGFMLLASRSGKPLASVGC